MKTVSDFADFPVSDDERQRALLFISEALRNRPLWADDASFTVEDFTPVQLRAIWEHSQAGRISYVESEGKLWIDSLPGLSDWSRAVEPPSPPSDDSDNGLPEPLERFLTGKATTQQARLMKLLWERRERQVSFNELAQMPELFPRTKIDPHTGMPEPPHDETIDKAKDRTNNALDDTAFTATWPYRIAQGKSEDGQRFLRLDFRKGQEGT